MKSDAAIRKAILGLIRSDEMLKANDNIQVDVNRGVVKLSGCVRDTSEKRSAERLASRIREVKAVAMDLQVVCPVADNDNQIAAEIADTFMSDPRLSGEQINVTVDNAWVTLEGEVDDYCKKVAAFNAVNDIQHVKGGIKQDYGQNTNITPLNKRDENRKANHRTN